VTPIDVTSPVIITIDGPAGAGKSTVGRAVAERLGLGYLDTGAMYRAVTFAALRRGIAVNDEHAVAELATVLQLDVVDRTVVVDGVDATGEIRGRDVTEGVSAIAANTQVREELRARQRQWAADRGGGVIEGRDIGTIVFPEATLKLFVTANPRVRAERRVSEIGGLLDDVEASITERDRRDMHRADGPLRAADGAVTIDTTGLTITEVVERIIELLPAPHDPAPHDPAPHDPPLHDAPPHDEGVTS